MWLFRLSRVISVLLLITPLLLPAQTGDVFTVEVSTADSAENTGVIYMISGDFGAVASYWATHDGENRFNFPMQFEGRPANSLKAAVYSPFCRLMTIEVEELNRGPRRSDFQCQELPKVALSGTVPVAELKTSENLEVEIYYITWWTHKFFNMADGGVFQLEVTRAPVQPDGTFTVNLPNFAADPLWSSLTKDAGILFAVNSRTTGRRVAILDAPEANSVAGRLKVAASYPDRVELQVPKDEAQQ